MSNEDKRERVTEVGPGTLDHEAVKNVIEVYRREFAALFLHYIIEDGDGPQKETNAVELLISLIISSIAGLLMDVSADDLGPKMKAIAEAMVAFADEADKYQAEKGKRSVH